MIWRYIVSLLLAGADTAFRYVWSVERIGFKIFQLLEMRNTPGLNGI
jgi:hypothetical protein